MNFKKFLVSSSVLLIISFSQQIWAQNDNMSNDAAITSHVKSEIAADNSVSNTNVNVSTQNGIVKLSGNVNDDSQASKLVEIASSTSGVKDTDTSGLHIKNESKSVFSDAAITAKVKGAYIREKLFGNKDVSVMSVNVDTTNGIVHLTGTVDTQEQASNAVKLAKAVVGVKSVKSSIKVSPSTT